MFEDRLLGSRAGGGSESLKFLLCYFRAKEGVWSLLPLCPKTHCGVSVSVCVTSLVQVIKILGTEKGKKNKSNLIFLAGNRVLKWMDRSHESEKALTSLLKYAPPLPHPGPAPPSAPKALGHCVYTCWRDRVTCSGWSGALDSSSDPHRML